MGEGLKVYLFCYGFIVVVYFFSIVTSTSVGLWRRPNVLMSSWSLAATRRGRRTGRSRSILTGGLALSGSGTGGWQEGVFRGGDTCHYFSALWPRFIV